MRKNNLHSSSKISHRQRGAQVTRHLGDDLLGSACFAIAMCCLAGLNVTPQEGNTNLYALMDCRTSLEESLCY